MKGNSLIEWLVKLIFALMLLPFLVSFALGLLAATFQAIVAFLFSLLPWVIGLAVLIVVGAAICALGTIGRRLPRESRRRLPAAGIQPVRRPRGPGRQDED